jgi:hypothetical protein
MARRARPNRPAWIWISVTAAFVVSLAGIGISVAGKPDRGPVADELYYVGVAYYLNEHGVYAGEFDMAFTQTPVPGRVVGPAYPVFIHLLSGLDPSLRKSIACHVRYWESGTAHCPSDFRTLIAANVAVQAFGAACVFIMALALAGSLAVAWCSLVLFLVSGEPGYYAATYLTENLAFPATFAFLACAAVALTRGSLAVAFGAGCAMAAATLSRPAYLYALLFCLLMIPVLFAAGARTPFRRPAAQAGLFLLGGLLPLLPWVVRNLINFGDPALTAEYGGWVLAPRVAYNAMSWKEWAVAWVYWIPSAGPDIAARMFPPELYERLGWGAGTYFRIGSTGFTRETLAAAGGPEGHVSYLVRNHVLDDPLKHIAVTLPLAWRGIWVGHYLSLAGILCLLPCLCIARRRGRFAPVVITFAPIAFMVMFHALISANLGRYNTSLIALYAFSVAWTVLVCVAYFRQWLAGDHFGNRFSS